MHSHKTIVVYTLGFLLVVISMISGSGSLLISQQTTRMNLIIGDGTPGLSDFEPVRFNKPIRLAPYGEGAILVADIYNHAIRIVTLEKRVRTIAGGPNRKGHHDGPSSWAMFDSPHGVAFNPTSGEIAVAEVGNHTIRLLTPVDPAVTLLEREYTVSTLAGVPGKPGYKDGSVREALFESPHALVYLPDGSIVTLEIGNARVRIIKDGEVQTIAGSVERGQADGVPLEAMFQYPMDLALAPDGSILIADAGTHSIRRLVIGKEVSTLDVKSELRTPQGITVDEQGLIYVADMDARQIISIDNEGAVTPVYGTGRKGSGMEDLNKPAAVLVHDGHLWIADLDNNQIKVISLSD